MSSFFMLKLKQAKHVQQDPNSIMVASVKQLRKNLRAKQMKTETKKSLCTQNNTTYSSNLNELMAEYDAKSGVNCFTVLQNY